MRKKRSFLAVMGLLVGTMSFAGGTAAYLSKSAGEVKNVFTAGSVKAQLTEAHWDTQKASKVYPGQSLEKDPVVKNIGTNDAFVFLRFSVPKQAVRIADQTGAAQASQVQELFDYTIHTDWVKVSEDTSAAAQNTYVYAYGTEAACKALVAEASTPSLFKENQITFINVLEGQGLEGNALEIPVEAYGIQTTDLDTDDKTAPADVWQILMNQVDTK